MQFKRVNHFFITAALLSTASVASAQSADGDAAAAPTTSAPVNAAPAEVKCTASISMRSIPSLPGMLTYKCSDTSILTVRAYVTVDGALVIVPMKREADGSFSTDIPVSSQGPTFIAFQQQGADKRTTITDAIPYAAACPDALAFLSEKNSPFGPVSERSMRQAVRLGQEIEQLSYIKGALERISSLGVDKGEAEKD